VRKKLGAFSPCGNGGSLAGAVATARAACSCRLHLVGKGDDGVGIKSEYKGTFYEWHCRPEAVCPAGFAPAKGTPLT
jgi:hypothetical protein